MGKMRIYEYAKQNDVKSKEVIEQLKKMDIEVSNHMSSITRDTINKLDKVFKQVEEQMNSDVKEQKQEKKQVRSNKKQKQQTKQKKAQPQQRQRKGKRR